MDLLRRAGRTAPARTQHPQRAIVFVAVLFGTLATLVAIGCGARSTARGIVQRVDRELGMVLIAHDAVPERLPAGETGFRVSNQTLLDNLAPGQVGRMVFAKSNGGYTLLEFGLERFATSDEGWIDLGGTRVRTDPAPALALIDHHDRPFTLADLAGRAVLLGFVYTQCPGPCPIQTSDHMAVRRGLSEDAAPKTWFVMVTIDPARDDAAALRAYMDDHGVDYENWTFLTGPVARVEATYERWGISVTHNADGTIDHTPIVFLLDARGRIVKRYVGVGQDPQEMIRDMLRVVDAIEAVSPTS